MAKSGEGILNLEQEQAASLVAAGERTHEEIAAHLGIGSRTLTRWKNLPPFQERVKELIARASQTLEQETIASVEERIRRRNTHWQRLNHLVDRRAQQAERDPQASEELKTGLYVPVVTRHKNGSEERTQRFDRDLVRSLSSMEELTGKELGQHVHRTELSGPGGGPIPIDLTVPPGYVIGTVADAAVALSQLCQAGRLRHDITDDELRALAQEINDRLEARRHGLEVPPMTEPYTLPESLQKR